MKIPRSFVVLDTEATDLLENDGAICEIAMIEVEDMVVVDTMHYIIDPRKPLSFDAAKANGFKDSDFVGKPTFKDLHEEIVSWLCTGKLVAGYNIVGFDKKMIALELFRIGVKEPIYDCIDLYKVVKDTFSKEVVFNKTGKASFSQSNIAKFLDIDDSSAHRALADCETLIKIIQKIIPETAITVVDADGKIASSVAKIDAKTIAENALSSITDFLEKYSHRLSIINSLSVLNVEESNAAANEIAWLKSIKADIVKSRQTALDPVKSLTSIVEGAFRDFAIKPIDAASEYLNTIRSTWLQKKYEEEVGQKRKLEQDAEIAAQAVFVSTPALIAADASNAVYDAGMKRAAAFVVDTVRKVNTGISRAKDEIVFDISIERPLMVPVRFLSPDESKIRKYVNDTKGEMPIPGVIITIGSKSTIRRV